jgi:RimJ/RimL family protein N-acetyltransferase
VGGCSVAGMRVELRPITDEDLPALFENQCDPIAAAMVGFPSREWDEFLAHRRKIEADPTTVTRAIVADGVLVGDIVSWDAGGEHDVGYWVDRAHWGHGIGTAALTAFLAEVTHRPLFAHVARHNGGSARVLAKCGFTPVPEHERPVDADPDEHIFVLT